MKLNGNMVHVENSDEPKENLIVDTEAGFDRNKVEFEVSADEMAVASNEMLDTNKRENRENEIPEEPGEGVLFRDNAVLEETGGFSVQETGENDTSSFQAKYWQTQQQKKKSDMKISKQVAQCD